MGDDIIDMKDDGIDMGCLVTLCPAPESDPESLADAPHMQGLTLTFITIQTRQLGLSWRAPVPGMFCHNLLYL
jgi:hypothetical protein